MLALMLAAAVSGPVAPNRDAAVRNDVVAGRWMTETRHGVVDPQSRDQHNKDSAQRQRPLKGLTMLQGFHEASQAWEGGSVYNPDDGGTYHGTVTIIDPKTLKVRGCIVWPLCKSQTWKRVG
jgi:uncharacterized protein (DUF2147 family)